jgi:hypothetical protein
VSSSSGSGDLRYVAFQCLFYIAQSVGLDPVHEVSAPPGATLVRVVSEDVAHTRVGTTQEGKHSALGFPREGGLSTQVSRDRP